MQAQRRMSFLALVIPALLIAAPAVAQQPALVVTARSADELIADFNYAAERAGHPQAAAIAAGFLNQLTHGKGLAGVDRSKPLGAYAAVSSRCRPENRVLFVPVADEKQFRELLRVFSPKMEQRADGTIGLEVWGQTRFAKFHDGYCYIARRVEALATPADLSTLGPARGDLTFDVRLDRIPDEAKELALTQLEQVAKRFARHHPPRRDVERQARELHHRIAMAIARAIVNDTERLTASFNLDRETKRITHDVTLVARPGTRLAAELDRYGRIASPFGSLADPQAAASLLVSAPVPAIIQQFAGELGQIARIVANERIDREPRLKTDEARQSARSVAEKLLAVGRATVKTGQHDAAVIVTAAPGGGARVLLAVKLAEGDQLAAALDEVRELAKDDPRAARFKADVARHGDTRIHAVEVRMGEATKHFGDGPVYLAIRNDSVWVAAGRDSLDALKSSLDAFGKSPPRQPAFALRVRPDRLLDLFGDPAHPLVARAKKVLAEGGADVVVQVLPVERGARLHIETGDVFLKCCPRAGQ